MENNLPEKQANSQKNLPVVFLLMIFVYILSALGFYFWQKTDEPEKDQPSSNFTNDYSPRPVSNNINKPKVNQFIDNNIEVIKNSTSCNDSDGGKNFYTKGFTGKENVPLYADGCYCQVGNDSSNLGFCLSGPYVGEWFCDKDGYPKMENYKCPNGCRDGACIKN